MHDCASALQRESHLDSGVSWWAELFSVASLSLGHERGEKRYRKIRSPAHEWPPLSGRSETVWRDSYLFPTEVDWNIFHRVGPHPHILLPFPELPSREERRDARTGSANLADFLWGKWRLDCMRSWRACENESFFPFSSSFSLFTL